MAPVANVTRRLLDLAVAQERESFLYPGHQGLQPHPRVPTALIGQGLAFAISR